MAKPVFTTKSSTIHKVEYNEKEKTMEIEFRSGNVYHYYNVPPRMWKIFQLYIEVEGSAGSFFNQYIKNQFTSEDALEHYKQVAAEMFTRDQNHPSVLMWS